MAKHRCQVVGCSNTAKTLRRGRCSRCSRRAQRGKWSHLDPADDLERYKAYVSTRPAAQLALGRVSKKTRKTSRAGAKLVARRRRIEAHRVDKLEPADHSPAQIEQPTDRTADTASPYAKAQPGRRGRVTPLQWCRWCGELVEKCRCDETPDANGRA